MQISAILASKMEGGRGILELIIGLASVTRFYSNLPRIALIGTSDFFHCRPTESMIFYAVKIDMVMQSPTLAHGMDCQKDGSRPAYLVTQAHEIRKMPT